MIQADVSMISHGHGPMVLTALQTLAKAYEKQVNLSLRVWLTLNVPEPDLVSALHGNHWPFNLQIITNSVPMGFGVNHNQAFNHAQKVGAGQWFIVLNPDIFWPDQASEFWSLLQPCNWPVDLGLLCPKQLDAQGHTQDYARRVITPWTLLERSVRRIAGLQAKGIAASVGPADWVNGAIMVWRSEVFKSLKGFDERYFMYCEDADICLRMRMAGWRMDDVNLAVVHDAQRNTRRNAQHMRWHLASLWRFWTSSVFWRYMWFKYNTKKM